LGGNSINNVTSFKLNIDRQAPLVVRLYQEASNLKLLTDEKSTCVYQLNSAQECNYNFEEGIAMQYSNSTEHQLAWDISKTYYIKCQDINGNSPISSKCSIVAKMFENNQVQ
jgi:hypothetical protein